MTPDRADVASFLEMVFGYLEAGEENHAYAIALRGVGEKGTDGEGNFIEPKIVTPLRGPEDVDRIFAHVTRWSQHQRASFIVPAPVAAAALSDNHATEDRILMMTNMVVDLDSGDTIKALAHAEVHIGVPSMVVESGGLTPEGRPKMHVYWRFTEATSDVAKIAATRKLLAQKLGGDVSFQRSTQVIRIPGSIYSKGGIARPCRIVSQSNAEYEPDELIQKIGDMPARLGIQLDTSTALTTRAYASGSGLNFSTFKAAKGDLADEKPDIGQSLTTDVHEGGIDRHRWGEFNRVAGLYIKQARDGLIKMDDARGMSHTWMVSHMKPTWPPARFESEFNGLVRKDQRSHGPIIEGNVIDFSKQTGVNNPNTTPPETVIERMDGTLGVPVKLEDWDIGQWVTDEKPTRRFLVEGLLQSGASCLIAAEGGAGKTFLLLDLATKIAMHEPGMLQSWCGLPLSDNAGGSVVMFTTEDDKRELQIRLAELLTREQRHRLKDRRTLKIVPTVNAGGAFPLVERKRAQGPARIGEVWQAYLEQIKDLPNLKLVAIDTLNSSMHGEENSATVINEYVQAATSDICGKMDASLVVTHHVRKPNANVKIFTPDDMKAAIRGSSAIIGAFRCVIGIWAAPDYKCRLTAMAMEAKRGQLYNLAVVKANNPEMDFNTRALLRQPSGLLVDITDKEKAFVNAAMGETEAWLVKAVQYAADHMHPFTVRNMSKRPPNGRRHQLPPILSDLPERDVDLIAKRLIEAGRIVQCNPAGLKTYNYLDVPGGVLARADAGEDGTLYKVAAGKDFEPPEWTAVYAYHKAEGRIVASGQETDRTIRAQKKPPASERPKGSFNPNNPTASQADFHGPCDGATLTETEGDKTGQSDA